MNYSKLERYTETISLIGQFLSIFAGLFISHLLTTEKSWAITSIVVIFFAVLITVLLRYAASYMLTITWVRKLILKGYYYEGRWFDHVIIKGIKYYGLITITYEHGKLKIIGQQFDSTGRDTGSWEDDFIGIRGNSICTSYTATEGDMKGVGSIHDVELKGFKVYQFIDNNGSPPVYYRALFLETNPDKKSGGAKAWKIQDKDIIEYLKTNGHDTTIIRTLIAKDDSRYV